MAQYTSLIKYFYEKGYCLSAALAEINSTFPDKPISRSTIYRWYKKLKNGVIDAPKKSWQRRMRLEIMDQLTEIVDQNPYSTSRDLAKLLNCSKNTVLRRLNELGYKNKLSTWTPHGLPACNKDRVRLHTNGPDKEKRNAIEQPGIMADAPRNERPPRLTPPQKVARKEDKIEVKSEEEVNVDKAMDGKETNQKVTREENATEEVPPHRRSNRVKR